MDFEVHHWLIGIWIRKILGSFVIILIGESCESGCVFGVHKDMDDYQSTGTDLPIDRYQVG